jgi:SAM-dependent methyltransferase
VGLTERTSFRQASALELPYEDACFDVVWTEHVQMNIEDKQRFYSEALRVLRPGGHLMFHDVFAGQGGPISFPVPWATDASMSFLATPEQTRELVGGLGVTEREWIITTKASQVWFEAAMDRNAKNGGPAPLGLHLLMGPSAKLKFGNALTGLRERRLCTVEAVFEKE